MDVSIVIVHFNTPTITHNCITSLIKHTQGVNYEIILIDNASTVHDASELKEAFPEILLIKAGENLGFAKGNNLGISQAKGKYILLLNTDTVLKDNAVKICYQYMEKHPRAGVVSARLVFPDGRTQSVLQRFPSLKYSLIQLLRLQKIYSKIKAGKILLGSFFNHAENAKGDWVWGAFFMFRSSILTLLPNKKLDDSFFMYGEDKQWCWDIKKCGYEVHFCAEAEVVHIMGGSNAKKEDLMNRNEKIFMKRNFTIIHREAIKFTEWMLLLSQKKVK